ncbi:DHHC zinc finger domain protein [Trichuris suis]|nr:DHHC zinc finger domain protein [Trichuris suis]
MGGVVSASYSKLRKSVHAKVEEFKFLFLFLFYNSHCNLDYAIDVAFEPVYRFVETYVSRLGRVFLGFLTSAIVLLVLITYVIIVPYELPRRSWREVILYFITGHWLLANLVFNLYKGSVSSPGHPPMNHLVASSVGICKSCLRPKPPRSHHCSVCRRCILKMDHHCPWLDQCVGHYNHRYYYLTMVYMWLSCVYVVIGVYRCFAEHYWTEEADAVPWCAAMKDKLIYANWFCSTSTSSICTSEDSSCKIASNRGWISYLILIEFFVCAAMVVGLIWLLVTHFIMISKGETSIEHHINQAMKKKYEQNGKIYVNPYDFGWAENWRTFLGIDNFRSDFFTKILLPSNYVPKGDGLSWPLAGIGQELTTIRSFKDEAKLLPQLE